MLKFHKISPHDEKRSFSIGKHHFTRGGENSPPPPWGIKVKNNVWTRGVKVLIKVLFDSMLTKSFMKKLVDFKV